MKCLDRLQLKARKLCDWPTIVSRSLGHRDERLPDVAADLHRQSCVTQQLADERSRRGLAVAASDRNDAAFQISIRALDFTNHFRAGSFGVTDRNDRRRNAGTDNHEIELIE